MRPVPDAPERPALRYHGGKWRLAAWIISHFPEHRIYVESFGGAASVLVQKTRSYAEVYNDLDSEIVNLFRVLRDKEQSRELIGALRLTPYSREEFEQTYTQADDPVEQARRTLFRSAAGYSTAGVNAAKWQTGFRGNVTRLGTTPAQDWTTLPDSLTVFVERLQGVVVENQPAIDVIARYDGPETLHYIDPPYPFSTRNSQWAGNCYRHEMTDDQHQELAWKLHDLAGMVVLSGYACPLYDDLYADWHRTDRDTYADCALKRTESLWLSPRTVEALNMPVQAVLL